jgi:hypothetical protein
MVELDQYLQMPSVEDIGHQAADHILVVLCVHRLLSLGAYMITATPRRQMADPAMS